MESNKSLQSLTDKYITDPNITRDNMRDTSDIAGPDRFSNETKLKILTAIDKASSELNKMTGSEERIAEAFHDTLKPIGDKYKIELSATIRQSAEGHKVGSIVTSLWKRTVKDVTSTEAGDVADWHNHPSGGEQFSRSDIRNTIRDNVNAYLSAGRRLLKFNNTAYRRKYNELRNSKSYKAFSPFRKNEATANFVKGVVDSAGYDYVERIR